MYQHPNIPKDSNENTIKHLRRWLRLFRHLKDIANTKRKRGYESTMDIREFFGSSGGTLARGAKRRKNYIETRGRKRKRHHGIGEDIRSFCNSVVN